MKPFLITLIYNLICIYFAIRIAIEVLGRIDRVSPGSGRNKRSPFGKSREEQIKEAQHESLDTFANIGAAILPILILTVIYLLLSESFYQLLVKYVDLKKYGDILGIAGAILCILSFFAGKKFSQNFLDPTNISSSIYKTGNIDLIRLRISRTEISYLSFTFGILLFNYLDLDLKFNVFKGISTSFVAGTIYYIVYLQDTPSHVVKNIFGMITQKKKGENADSEPIKFDEND